MKTKYRLFIFCCALTQISLPMDQLAGSALIQASATIIAIVPQLQSESRSCVINESTSDTSVKTTKTAIDETGVAQLLQQLLVEQRKQTELLQEINQKDDSYFVDFISTRTMLWFITCAMFVGIPGSFSNIIDKLENITRQLCQTNDQLCFINNSVNKIND